MVKGQVLALIIMMLLVVTGAEAQGEFGIKGRINDYAGILSNSQKHQLHQILSQHQFAKKHYITVLTAAGTGDESAEVYAEKLMQAWDSKRKPNSVLLLLLKEQKAAIVSGKQLEKKMSPEEGKKIVEELVLPPLQQGDYDTAAMEGIKAITGVLNR